MSIKKHTFDVAGIITPRPAAEELWRILFMQVPKVQGRPAESLRQKDRAGCPSRGLADISGVLHLSALFCFDKEVTL